MWCIPQKLGSSEKVDERITDDDHETWIHCKTSQICPTFTVSSDSYRAHWLWNVGLGCGGRIRGVKNETLKLRNAATLDGLSDQHFAFFRLQGAGCRVQGADFLRAPPSSFKTSGTKQFKPSSFAIPTGFCKGV